MRAQLKPRIKLDGRPDLAEYVRDGFPTPWVVFVDPASACNFRCKFCPTGHHDLVAGRFNGIMKFDLFQKVVEDLLEFDRPVKVLRLYKDGEPFLNRRLSDMVVYAKMSGCVEMVDTTTNGSLLDPERVWPVIDAGLDRINVSIEGVTKDAYREVACVEFDFDRLVRNVRWLYEHRGQCVVHVKTIREALTGDQEVEFKSIFGDHCDEIFVENFSPCWPEFDGEAATGWKIARGLYGQPVTETEVCPYIFYGYSVNADGQVSACFIDWARKLVVGDVRRESMRDIWKGERMTALRLAHLRGERRCHGVCGKCGQLSNCLPDNIDAHRLEFLEQVSAT